MISPPGSTGSGRRARRAPRRRVRDRVIASPAARGSLTTSRPVMSTVTRARTENRCTLGIGGSPCDASWAPAGPSTRSDFRPTSSKAGQARRHARPETLRHRRAAPGRDTPIWRTLPAACASAPSGAARRVPGPNASVRRVRASSLRAKNGTREATGRGGTREPEKSSRRSSESARAGQVTPPMLHQRPAVYEQGAGVLCASRCAGWKRPLGRHG
jgi:hypothetical protein